MARHKQTETAQPKSERLNTDEAARYCGLAKATLDQLRSKGGGPIYIKLGRRVIYDTADLDQWLAAQKFKSSAEEITRRREA
jgi:predicted DNA-binding transcriptional regulator AlpA